MKKIIILGIERSKARECMNEVFSIFSIIEQGGSPNELFRHYKSFIDSKELPTSNYCRRVFKYRGEYYSPCYSGFVSGGFSLPARCEGKVKVYEKIDLECEKRRAEVFLREIINEPSLSSGDKLIINTIARQTLLKTLDVVVNEGPWFSAEKESAYTMGEIVHVEYNLMAHCELQKFGFRIRKPKRLSNGKEDGVDCYDSTGIKIY